VKWWGWWRRPVNAEAAKRANKAASEQLRDAHGRSGQVDETTRAAREMVRRTDLFAREIERSLRLRGSS
jgi:hypothetical protein